MTPFTQTQRVKALFWLSLFHLLVITSSNYLVQLPISIFGFHTTWGAFSFPFIFLATDLTVRIFGAPLARRIIFAVNRLRQNRRWWLAPTASTLFGNISDTLAFFFIAFWRSPDAFMAEHWMEIALVDYCFKVLISIIFFLPMYGVLLNMLLKRLADKSEISALQTS